MAAVKSALPIIAAIVLACAVTLCAATADTTRVWMEQDMRPRVPDGWQRIGRPAADAALSLTIVMRLRNLRELERIAEAVSTPQSPEYGRYRTLAEIHELTAPPASAVATVTSWLTDAGVSEIAVNDGGAFVRATMPVRKAEELLGVTYHTYHHAESGVELVRAVEHYSLPSRVAEVVALVGGIARFPRAPKNLVRQQAERVSMRSTLASQTTPAFIQSRYNVTIAPSQSKNIQAVASFLNQFYSPSDLTKFQTKFKLTPLSIENTIGPNQANKPGVEASLDVQYLTGVTNDTIRTWVWSTAGEVNGNEPFLDWLQAVDNATTVPNLFSISYQDLEYTVSLEYATSVNAEFTKNTVRGITFLTGSGDWGVGCEDSAHCNVFTADFPSSSPYVTSVGGTTITGTAGETGVSFSSGGFSNYFGQPSYQAAAVQKWLSQSNRPPSQYYNISGRAFPDLSAVSTNFQVVVDGVVMPVGGTSASTPTVAAMISMINSLRISQGKPTLGNINPALYAAWAQSAANYHDITTNQKQDTGCCPYSFSAVAGWDPVTGLGTPNYGNLASFMLSSTQFNFPKKA